MALTDADKKEMTDLFADAMVQGLAKFRSLTEEEEAKRKVAEDAAAAAAAATGKNTGKGGTSDSGSDGGFSLAGFILGG